MDKTPNYTPAQEQLIRDAIAANGGVADKSVADGLASLDAMNLPDGTARKPRSIIAKMTRMDGVNYASAPKTRKDGTAIALKSELVAEIAKASGKTFEALEKASRDDLVKLRDWAVSLAA